MLLRHAPWLPLPALVFASGVSLGCAPAAKPETRSGNEAHDHGTHEHGGEGHDPADCEHCKQAGKHGKHGKHGHDAKHGDHDESGSGHHHGKGGFHKEFDDAEKWVAKFEGPERDAWQKPDVLMDAIGVTAGEAVADLGAGTGYLLPHLTARVGAKGSVLALDVSESMVEHMQGRVEAEGWSNVEARVVGPDDPKIEGANLERIVMVNVWHHVSDREAYARRVLSGLAPGGTFFIVDFTKDSPVGPPAEHRLESSAVEAELQAAGFQTRVVEAELPNQYIVAGTRPPA